MAYYPKVAIPNWYKSNKWRHLKASFRGYLGNKQVKECGFHLIYMPKIVSRTIPQDIYQYKRHQARSYTNIDTVPRCSKMLWHQISSRRYWCWWIELLDDTHNTDHDHSSIDTIKQNIDDNAVDAQDDEEDHMHKWLYLLCKSIQWICCWRY